MAETDHTNCYYCHKAFGEDAMGRPRPRYLVQGRVTPTEDHPYPWQEICYACEVCDGKHTNYVEKP